MRDTRIISWAALGTVAIGAACTLSCGPEAGVESHTQAQSGPPAAVQTTRPAQRNVSRLIALPGDVRPWAEATLYAKVPGYLGTIDVDRGDRVRQGQVLAVIEAPELKADRDQAQQVYESARAAAQGSRAAGERTAAEQARAEAAADKARTDLAQAAAAIAKAKAQAVAAQGGVQQAEAQKRVAEVTLAESRAEAVKAAGELEGAKADQSLAQATYERYRAIFTRNPMLLAKQDLDVAESRAKGAVSHTIAAQGAAEAAQHRVEASRERISAADAAIDEARSQADAALRQVDVTVAEQNSTKKQSQIADRDIAISRKQQGVARAKSLEAGYQAAAGRSALSKTALIADYSTIRAPFSGVITKRFVDPGAFIQTAATSQNAAAIVTVADLNTVRLTVNVPETEAGFIQRGTAVKISFASAPDALISARIARTTDSLDPKTRTLQAEVDLPNRNGKILAGSYATVRVVLETHPGVLSVPSAAVGSEKSGKFVYVVEGGKAKRVGVTVGFNDGAYTEILAGLHGGEQVVVTGRDALTPGAAVRAAEWTPPAGAAHGRTG